VVVLSVDYVFMSLFIWEKRCITEVIHGNILDQNVPNFPLSVYTSHPIMIPYIALNSVHTNVPSDNSNASDNRFGLVDAQNVMLDIINKPSFQHYHP